MNKVFIIGAGASKEFSLPTGEELKKKISSLLDIKFPPHYGEKLESGDDAIVNALQYFTNNGDIGPFTKEAWHIRDTLNFSISIDNYIDSHKGNEIISLCCKLAIARSILLSERHSHLNIENHISQEGNIFPRLNPDSECWLFPFVRLLTENCQIDNLEERLSPITFIIFNYDRCVEQFLFHSLKNFYNISDNETADILSKVKIFHPYGSVGKLPFYASTESIPFGAMDLNPELLLSVAQGIKTFTEGADPKSSDILSIKKQIRLADEIIFLGFAFHNLNMDLIVPPYDIDIKEKKCYATTKGLSNNSVEIVKSGLCTKWFPKIIRNNSLYMSDKRCFEFFYEYWKGLSFVG